MTGAEQGFLLLASSLGDPVRKPLTTAQLRNLSRLAGLMEHPAEERELCIADLTAIGCGKALAQRILDLLSETDVLEHYMSKGRKAGCTPLTRISGEYPARLRDKLAAECPAVLWAKGDTAILHEPKIALVGSRDINNANKAFAEEAGRQAALQGYTLVSGNARGSDRIAQTACLRHGGKVISIVADALFRQQLTDRVLYLSEEDFDARFSAQRALSRNRVIHALADKVLVAQSSLEMGGTWAGTVKNLKHGWSSVFCFRDGSEACARLAQMGAQAVTLEDLQDLGRLKKKEISLFDR